LKKGFTKSFKIEIISNDTLEQLTNTRKLVVDKLVENLNMMKGLKWVTTLQITFEKQNNENEIMNRQAVFNSKADTILNENDLNEIQSTNQIVSKIGNWIKQGFGWITLDEHYFNVTQYPL